MIKLFSPKLNLRDQYQFVRQLAFLVKANISLPESLAILRAQTTTKKQQKFYDELLEQINNGITVADSLARSIYQIQPLVINVIRVGESSGNLAPNLEHLARELYQKTLLRRKIIGIIAYPAVISMVTLSIALFLLWYILPKILPILGSVNAKLPWSTRFLLAANDWLADYGAWLFLFIGTIIFIYPLLTKRYAKMAYWQSRISLHLPIIGRIKRDYTLANLSRTLGLLMASGATEPEAIEIAAETIADPSYRQALIASLPNINAGETLHRQTEKYHHLFPPAWNQLVRIGETTGDLAENLEYLAKLYESELDDFSKTISGLIEPALMILIGLTVGFITMAIITPIYAITQNIGR